MLIKAVDLNGENQKRIMVTQSLNFRHIFWDVGIELKGLYYQPIAKRLILNLFNINGEPYIEKKGRPSKYTKEIVKKKYYKYVYVDFGTEEFEEVVDKLLSIGWKCTKEIRSWWPD